MIMKKIYITFLFAAISLFSSCDDWLTVEPKDMVTVDKALTTPEGYTSALVGVYQILQNVYNPGGFVMGSGVDTFANIYTEPSIGFSQSLNSAYNYNFSDTSYDNSSGAAFLQMYKAITNLNVILSSIETTEVLTAEQKNFVEGEARALRGFLHFDIWRIYGTAPDDNAGTSNLILPYSLEVSNEFIPYLNYNDYFANILSDLEQAKDMLSFSDPIIYYSNELLNVEGSIEEYEDLGWYNRQNRFNYYATLGALARVQLWMGNKEQAYEYAKEVVDAQNEDGTRKFRLGTSTDMGNTDLALFVEQLFGVETLGYDDTSYSSYTAHCVNSEYVLNQVYPSSSDIRKMNLFTTLTSNALVYNAQISLKYSLMSENDASAYKNFPIIRVSEMYLILVETAPTIAEAQTYYDTFANSRFDENVTLTEGNLQENILNQYTREFWAEGQIFYTYKRLSLTSLPFSGQEMNTDKYKIAIPSGETNSDL